MSYLISSSLLYSYTNTSMAWPGWVLAEAQLNLFIAQVIVYYNIIVTRSYCVLPLKDLYTLIKQSADIYSIKAVTRI